MRSTIPGTVSWLVILVPCALLGCGLGKDPHGRQGLAGTVMFQGKPLDSGSIKFLPADNTDLSAGAMIRAGKYHVPREQGLVPGTYRVLISALEPTPTSDPAAPPGSEPVEPARERIPAEYNLATRLKIEVKADQDNTFDFEIPERSTR